MVTNGQKGHPFATGFTIEFWRLETAFQLLLFGSSTKERRVLAIRY